MAGGSNVLCDVTPVRRPGLRSYRGEDGRGGRRGIQTGRQYEEEKREREKQRGRNEGELRKGGEVKSEKGKHYPPTQLGTDLEIPQIKSALRLGPADVSIMAVLSLSLSPLFRSVSISYAPFASSSITIFRN